MLDVGRLRIDQISYASHKKLNIEAAVLRRIVSKPWGLLSNQQRFELREVLRHHLATTNSTLFPLYEYQSVGDVLAHLFERLPQMSWTSCRGLVCCDGRLQTDKLLRVRRMTGLNLTFTAGCDYTIEELLQSERLDPSRDPEKQQSALVPCSLEKRCVKCLSPVMVVLNRLPPTLFLSLGPIPKGNSRTWRHMFDPINTFYTTSQGLTSTSYMLVGCIFQTGGNHFVLRWQFTTSSSNSGFEYDGLASAKLVKVGGWKDSSSTSAVLVALFYRQI